jgi:hypothetical protein
LRTCPRRSVTEKSHIFHTNRRSGWDQGSNPGHLRGRQRCKTLSHPLRLCLASFSLFFLASLVHLASKRCEIGFRRPTNDAVLSSSSSPFQRRRFSANVIWESALRQRRRRRPDEASFPQRCKRPRIPGLKVSAAATAAAAAAAAAPWVDEQTLRRWFTAVCLAIIQVLLLLLLLPVFSYFLLQPLSRPNEVQGELRKELCVCQSSDVRPQPHTTCARSGSTARMERINYPRCCCCC